MYEVVLLTLKLTKKIVFGLMRAVKMPNSITFLWNEQKWFSKKKVDQKQSLCLG